MQAQFESPRSDALFIACIIWCAGLMAAVGGLLAYIAVQAYDPSVSCDELFGKAITNGLEHPPDVDSWDNWELLCGYYD